MAQSARRRDVEEFVELVRAIEEVVEGWRDADDAAARIAASERVGLRLVGWIDGHEERYEALLESTPETAQDWLLDLAPTLARHGRHASAETIARALAAVSDAECFLPDLALGLARGGAADAARRIAAECERRFPDDDWVAITCGDVHQLLGDQEEAERHYGRSLRTAHA